MKESVRPARGFAARRVLILFELSDDLSFILRMYVCCLSMLVFALIYRSHAQNSLLEGSALIVS